MIKFRHAMLAAAAALSLAVAGQPAAALTPDTVWVKAGGTGEATVAAMDDCVARSNNVNVPYTPGYTTPGVAGNVGASIGNAIMESMFEAAARRASIPDCMYRLGYVRMRATAEEAAADRKAKTPQARSENLQAIYAAPDFAARFAVAARRVMPLPVVGPDTFVYREMRIDPTALTVTQGVVDKGVVLEGDVQRRGIATLANEPTWDGLPDGIPAEAVWVEIVVPDADRTARNYWCWHKPFMRGAWQYCVSVGPEGGYHINRRIALPSVVTVPAAVLGEAGFNDVDFVLHPEAKDPLDPIHIAFAVRKVDNDGVTLAIDRVLNKNKLIIWSQFAAFDAKGDAVIPMWTYRLKLHHTGDGVTVAFTQDGDGKPLPPDDPSRCLQSLTSSCT
ncbi:MAG TPA: hypothetical protein VG407_05940 [Caulobacteraceae bacterium]|jgi:hypothetical protein|nr:hypothetical protein [Caulobacteraceae bacterium]